MVNLWVKAAGRDVRRLYYFKMADDQAASEKEGKLNQLSLSKIKTIMRSSPDLANVSQESVFLITRATVSDVGTHFLNAKRIWREKSKLPLNSY